MNVCEMHEVQLELEHQYPSEDTQNGVHLSVVRHETRTGRNQAVWSDRQKRIMRWTLIIACVLVEIAFAMFACVEVGTWASTLAYRERGYFAIGSELLAGPIAGVIVGVIVEKLIGGVEALNNELE